MILALSQTSPAAASNSLHFYDRVLRKFNNNSLSRGTFTAERVWRGCVSTVALCYFAGSNEINRRLSGRGCVRLHLFCRFKRNQPPIVWEGVRQVAFVLLVETRLTADCLRGVRQLASVVEPEQPPIAQF